MLSAIVLAAGSSKRMGSINKLLLPYKSKTVLATVTENILAAGIEEVIVVTGHEAEKVKEALGGLPVYFAENKNHEKGMTTSIQMGIRYAKGNGYMICLSDMVAIEPREYALLKSEFEKQLLLDSACICIPLFKNEKGNPVIFSANYKDTILHHKEMEGCKSIVQENQEHIYRIEMNTAHILQDMDYPEDYEKMKSVMTGS